MQHNSMPYMNPPPNSAGTHVIPVQVDSGPNQFYHQQSQQQPNVQRQAYGQQRPNNNYEDMPYMNVRQQNKNNAVQPQNYVDNR